MFTTQMEKFADILIEQGISKSEDRDIVVYGLCTGIELLLNIITTLILGILFGMVLESLVFLISFSFVRVYAGGYHCEKAISCYFMSTGIVVFVLSIVEFIPTEQMMIMGIVILLVATAVLLKLVPMETPTKPLDELERQYYRKKTIYHLMIECVLACGLFLLQLDSFALVICLGVLVSAWLVFWQKISVINQIN